VTHVELGEDLSLFGHDTFLLDLKHIGGNLGRFLSWAVELFGRQRWPNNVHLLLATLWQASRSPKQCLCFRACGAWTEHPFDSIVTWYRSFYFSSSNDYRLL